MRSIESMVASPRWARRGLVTLVAAAAALFTVSCDFEVTNPGPVQDEFLDEEGAFEAVVNGMGRGLADAMNWVAFHGAAVARELHPTGGTGSFGLNVPLYNGELRADEQGAAWDNSQQARWISDDGLARLERQMGSATFGSSQLVARGFMWAGYANRLLGENMCQAVFDGGAPVTRDQYLVRAEERFTDAIQIGSASGATSVVTAATAGRASVRAFMGDWTGAVADAASVPDAFVFKLSYFDDFGESQYNRIHWATRNQPYKTATVWGTVYELEFLESNDPRILWVDSGGNGDGAVDCCGPVPFYVQKKYPERGSDITLSSGYEMRLIEAEARLVNQDINGAMAKINAVRAAHSVAARPVPTDINEAWRLLKRERGIQLWMEARRLGDMYRWDRDGTPGALHPRELPGAASHMVTQDLCFPIADSERDTNPNIP